MFPGQQNFEFTKLAADKGGDFNRASILPPFQRVYAGSLSELGIRSGIHGKYEAEVTLIGGAKNLYKACDQINESLQKLSTYPSKSRFSVSLSDIAGVSLSTYLPEGDGNLVYVITPVIHDSMNRHYVRDKGGDYVRASQRKMLEFFGLSEVPRDILLLAAGMFRWKHGFPEKGTWIGKGIDQDPGNLLEGLYIRTKGGFGLGDGIVKCDSTGFHGTYWSGNDEGHELIGIAGQSSVELRP